MATEQIVTQWYETQLAGVVAGGLIGFLGTSLRELYSNWRLKKSLKAGIISEVKVFKGFLDNGLKQLKRHNQELLDHLLKDKRTRAYEFTTGFKFTFLDKNLEKIGILKETMVSALIEIRSIAETKQFISYIDESIKRAEQATRDLKIVASKQILTKDDLNRVNDPFDRVKATYSHLIKLCGQVIS
jgi:hypothetical protein